jgi:hypothetical protein
VVGQDSAGYACKLWPSDFTFSFTEAPVNGKLDYSLGTLAGYGWNVLSNVRKDAISREFRDLSSAACRVHMGDAKLATSVRLGECSRRIFPWHYPNGGHAT